MPPLLTCRWCLLVFFIGILCFRCTSAVSFEFKDFGESSRFESQIAAIGDVQYVNKSKAFEMSGSCGFSAGKLVYKNPFSLLVGNSTSEMAFSSYFVFSVPRENGNGFAFFMEPAGFPLNLSDVGMLFEGRKRLFSVEFDAFKNEKYGDLRSIHGHDVESHVSFSHIPSPISLKLYSGEKLQAWINYEATGKRIEVSLRKFGNNDPYIPLLSYPIDLSALWQEAKLVIGLMSLSRNSSQKTSIYSWSFVSRNLANLLHSMPMNTDHFTGTPVEVKQSKKSDCATRIALALMFGAACGSLAALCVVFMWGLVKGRPPVIPEVMEMHEAAKKSECKKVDAFNSKTIEDGNY